MTGSADMAMSERTLKQPLGLLWDIEVSMERAWLGNVLAVLCQAGIPLFANQRPVHGCQRGAGSFMKFHCIQLCFCNFRFSSNRCGFPAR
jgi:hypothetical protein